MTEHTPTLDAGLAPGTDIRLTWWGNATVAIETGERAIVIDPYVLPNRANFSTRSARMNTTTTPIPKP